MQPISLLNADGEHICSQLAYSLGRPGELESLLQPGTYNAEQALELFAASKNLAEHLETGTSAAKQELILKCIARIELHDTAVAITLNNMGLLEALGIKANLTLTLTNLVIHCPAMKVRRGKELRLIIPPSHSTDIANARDEKLVALIVESRATLDLILAHPHKSLPTLAAEEGRCRGRMAKLAKLACLAPPILTMILDGKQPLNLTPRRLLDTELPLCWDEQRRTFALV